MKLLIDTHILLWVVENDLRLKKEIRKKIDEAEVVYVSMASIWEIAIKVNLDKLKFIDFENIVETLESFGFEILSLKCEHLLCFAKLPLLHRDPFDRMLIAQAKSEPLILITEDKHIQGYF